MFFILAHIKLLSFSPFTAGGKGDTYHNGKLVEEGKEEQVSGGKLGGHCKFRDENE